MLRSRLDLFLQLHIYIPINRLDLTYRGYLPDTQFVGSTLPLVGWKS